jgi:hypothetical protein
LIVDITSSFLSEKRRDTKRTEKASARYEEEERNDKPPCRVRH